MASKSNPVVILHILGGTRAGKSTFCRLFFESLVDTSILAVDPSLDQFMALSYGVSPPRTLADCLDQLEGLSLTSGAHQESIDWLLQDLLTPIDAETETDILSLGALRQAFTPQQKAALDYGMPRLFRQYDLVIWDGPLGVPEPAFQSLLGHWGRYCTIELITPEAPETFEAMAAAHAQVEDPEALNRYVVFSKAEASAALPPSWAQAIKSDDGVFLGKVPPVEVTTQGVSSLAGFMKECLYKLNLPFVLQHRLPLAEMPPMSYPVEEDLSEEAS